MECCRRKPDWKGSRRLSVRRQLRQLYTTRCKGFDVEGSNEMSVRVIRIGFNEGLFELGHILDGKGRCQHRRG